MRCTATYGYTLNSESIGSFMLNIPGGTTSRMLSWEMRSFTVNFVWFQWEQGAYISLRIWPVDIFETVI